MAVDGALIRAEVLVSDRNEDNGDEGKGEGEARGYVPLLKDDTGIHYLGVPAEASRYTARSSR